MIWLGIAIGALVCPLSLVLLIMLVFLVDTSPRHVLRGFVKFPNEWDDKGNVQVLVPKSEWKEIEEWANRPEGRFL